MINKLTNLFDYKKNHKNDDKAKEENGYDFSSVLAANIKKDKKIQKDRYWRNDSTKRSVGIKV